MYDAPYQVHTLLLSLANTTLTTELAAVASERSVRVRAPSKVYGYFIAADRQNVIFPSVEVRQPEGQVVIESAQGQSTSTLECWILANVSSGSLDELSDQAAAYLAALARTYLHAEGYIGTAPYEMELTEVSSSPPYTLDSGTAQTVGVRVLVRIAEDI